MRFVDFFPSAWSLAWLGGITSGVFLQNFEIFPMLNLLASMLFKMKCSLG
jgi:hypothetical protein